MHTKLRANLNSIIISFLVLLCLLFLGYKVNKQHVYEYRQNFMRAKANCRKKGLWVVRNAKLNRSKVLTACLICY